MRLMGLQAIYRAPRTSDPHPEHRVYPYLLKGMSINRSNQGLVRRHQCAAASGVRDGSRPPATGLQEQVANHRKWLWSKAAVGSVTEKVL